MKLDVDMLRAAFALAPIGVTITRDGITEYCNPAYLAMFGYEEHEQEIYGKSLLAMVAPDERGKVTERIARRRAGSEPEAAYDSMGLRRDGTRFPFHVSARRVDLSDGPATLAFFFELEERRRIEEDLRDTNEQLTALIRACPVPIMLLDPNGVVRVWNPAAEQTFGYSAQEAIGRVNPIVGEAELGEFQRNVRDALAIGLRGVEAHRTRKDGRPVEISIWAAPVRDAMGQSVGTIALTIDLTARKQTEEALRASQEQLRHAQKMEAVGRLAGGVAHDFNNLLTVISGFASLLRAQLAKHEAALTNVAEIQHAVDRAATLTGQLLAFSRHQELRLETVDLNEVVTSMQGMLSRLIGPQIELCTDLDPELGCVRADAGQLEQVITNLAVNGIDAMPDGGQLRLSTRNVGSYVVLDVTDTGTGMDEAVRSRLFEPFFTTKERGKGTGLGLSTVYGIVTQSGGQVQVRSKPGAGSTFLVYLPRVECEASAAKGPSSRDSRRGQAAIVLVEDDPIILRLVGEVLAGAGYEVHTATNADHALELLDQHDGRIRLLLTDVLMPGATGPELAERAWARHHDLRVLFMSGYAEPTSFPPHVAERAAGYLSKPFEPEGLLEKVEQALSKTA